MRERIAKISQIIFYWPFYGILKILFRLTVEGQENLKGLEDRAVIFASNHASYLDGFISAGCVPRNPGEFYPKGFYPQSIFSTSKDG